MLEREGIEFLEILLELPEPLATLAWSIARAAASRSSMRREVELFPADEYDRIQAEITGSRCSTEARRALSAAARTFRDPFMDADAAEAVRGFQQLSTLARASSGHRSAHVFADLAARTCPNLSALGLSAASTAREAGLLDRAEGWGVRTVLVARTLLDWESYTHAYIILATVAHRRGAIPEAVHRGWRALRRARRIGNDLFIAWACHHLYVCRAQMGAADEAEDLALEALARYQPRASGRERLVHDIGYAWIEEGRFEDGLQVMEALLERGSNEMRLHAAPNSARAYAALGDRETFERLAETVSQAIRSSVLPAEDFLELARGAAHLGMTERARAYASEAERLAGASGRHKVQFAAQAVLDRTASPEPRPARPERVDAVLEAISANSVAL